MDKKPGKKARKAGRKIFNRVFLLAVVLLFLYPLFPGKKPERVPVNAHTKEPRGKGFEWRILKSMNEPYSNLPFTLEALGETFLLRTDGDGFFRFPGDLWKKPCFWAGFEFPLPSGILFKLLAKAEPGRKTILVNPSRVEIKGKLVGKRGRNARLLFRGFDPFEGTVAIAFSRANEKGEFKASIPAEYGKRRIWVSALSETQGYLGSWPVRYTGPGGSFRFSLREHPVEISIKKGVKLPPDTEIVVMCPASDWFIEKEIRCAGKNGFKVSLAPGLKAVILFSKHAGIIAAKQVTITEGKALDRVEMKTCKNRKYLVVTAPPGKSPSKIELKVFPTILSIKPGFPLSHGAAERLSIRKEPTARNVKIDVSNIIWGRVLAKVSKGKEFISPNICFSRMKSFALDLGRPSRLVITSLEIPGESFQTGIRELSWHISNRENSLCLYGKIGCIPAFLCSLPKGEWILTLIGDNGLSGSKEVITGRGKEVRVHIGLRFPEPVTIEVPGARWKFHWLGPKDIELACHELSGDEVLFVPVVSRALLVEKTGRSLPRKTFHGKVPSRISFK